MKRVLFALICIATLVGCTKKEGEEDITPKIIGTWKCSVTSLYVDEQSTTKAHNLLSLSKDGIARDGYTAIDFDYTTYSSNGKWTVDGNYVRITWSESDKTDHKLFLFLDNILSYTHKDLATGIISTYTYIKISDSSAQ